MESERAEKIFTCFLCGMNEKYHYYGRSSPFVRSISFTEDAYIAKDPFAPKGHKLFLLLGSHCSVCNNVVCQSKNCSIFYIQRFCVKCAKQHISRFPSQIQKDISKI
ncbi:cysteine-rich DPF motif domain-containing protein 1-like isoform X2 [Centruroides sculpturatus]|uniref:cysteine-rich DPF motif domain-containing protein 1-like isoform X2 n=1 Tax=Centruroides sculpturatus TaxID=218467 RepID=UPI000C6E40D1|nr:cysteine-rich DPF motif domain-containing protein 1-like isoform X2 [Centruroides sculpturatus]